MTKVYALTAALMTGIVLLLANPLCHAELVEGQAVIENGDIGKAREAAMRDAMRTFVERQVGIHVQSTSEVAMNMVVSDRIITRSDGYVQINQIVSGEAVGGIYVVKLDLTADSQKIDTAISDLKGRLEAIDSQNTSRSGIQVAVTGRNENGGAKSTADLMRYVQSKLEDAGFRVEINDEVSAYMDSHPDLDSVAVSAEIRRLSRNTQEGANALLRGTLSTMSVSREGKYAKAMVKASFELIGFETSIANSYVDLFTAVALTEREAIQKAENMATQKAVEALSQKALKTVQAEFQGGVKNLKMTTIFYGITNRSTQGEQIRQGLNAAGCRIIRSSYARDGSFRAYLESSSYSTAEELKTAILQNVGMGLQEGNENESAMGARKLYFTF